MPIREVDPTSKLPPLKQLDLELLDKAPVRERIKQWQRASGGVPPKEDDNAGASVKAESTKITPSSVPSHTRSKSVEPLIADLPSTPTESKTSERFPATDPVKPRAVERKPRTHRLDHELKKASAPKKRVVSDGHWVKDYTKPEEKQPDSQYAWVRQYPKPEEKPSDPQYAWLREHVKSEEKQPDPQHGWTRAPILPRHQPEPLAPLNPQKEIKVYAAHPRRKSFVSLEQSGHSNDDLRKLPSPKKPSPPKPASPTKLASPKKPSPPKPNHEKPTSQRAPHEFISDWARNVGPLTESVVASDGEDEPAPKTHRASRNRRANEMPPYYKETPTSPKTKRTSLSQDQLSSSERNARPSHRASSRGKSAENLNESKSKPRRRRSSLQHSPEQIEADEFTQHRRASHRRGKSVGAALTEKTREHVYNDSEEACIHAGGRRASYREEFSRHAPADYVPERRVSANKQSRMDEQYDTPSPVDIEVAEDPGSPKVYGNRIEAWLSGTQDPFTDAGSEGKQSRRVFSYEDKGTRRTPSTLDTTSRQSDSFHMSRSSRTGSRGKANTNTTYSNHDRDVPSTKQSELLDPETEVEHSSTTSVPSLKRRGARHNSPSPTKERTKSPSAADSKFESDIASSIVSSSVDASKFIPPDAPARHSANGAVRKLQFNTKRLSTIVSESTFKQPAQPSSSGASESTVRPAEDDDGDTITHLTTNDEQSMVSTVKSRTSLKRRLTKHSDLMSVLSMDAPPKTKSIVSARSIRTHRSRLATATVADLMKEVASDEIKYMRELKTLTDDVILVLLKSVISKSDAALAAGLYSRAPSSQDVTNATKLIRELVIALNRLKTLHQRIPKEDVDYFLNWAQSAHKIYTDYVRTWRMGFEDVVVNLTTDDGGKSTVSAVAKSVHGGSWDEGLPRNEDGYVVDGDGARVDVAFLLKRPLVRLKYLTKTVKGINLLKPSAKAESLEKTFQELMEAAKKRVNEEKARMEDESANMIDVTRARDPKSLAPLKGVKIEPGRCVRARDYFDLHLDHTNGEAVDCRVELLLRDNAPGKGSGGDLLVCEVDNSSRWLLLPPIELDRVSARKGNVICETVVMIRGMSSSGQEWRELLTLYNLDEGVGSEWVQMLGSEPMPPSILELKDAMVEATTRPTSSYISSSYLSDRTESTVPQKSRTPSPREIEIPIGEQATSRSKRWGYETPERDHGYVSGEESPITPPTSESDYARIKKPLPKSAGSDKSSSPWSTFKDKFTHKDELPKKSSSPRADEARTPKDLNEAMDLASSSSPGLKRATAKRYRLSPKSSSTTDSLPLRHEQEDLKLPERSKRSISPGSPKKSQRPKDDLKRTTSKGFSVWMPPSTTGSDDGSDEDDIDSQFSTSSTRPVLSQRPTFERRASSVPSLDLPDLPKLRSSSTPAPRQTPSTPERYTPKTTPERVAPASAPSKAQKKPPEDLASKPKSPDHDTPPPPPPHRTLSSSQTPSKATPTPQFTPTPQLKRRSSSPLKHEYQPSSASSSDLSDDSASYHDSDSMTSDSEDELDDDDDTISYVMPSLAPKSKPPTPPKTLYSIPEATLKPADSASQIHAQAPYRQVPQTQPATETSSKTIACLFGWASAKGSWEQLHPDECSIVVLPGLIAAYEMSSAHNSKGLGEAGARPLIAMELTPRVMIRRGTGLDISLRSPPTAASRLKTGDTVMFRSRSQEECEILYQLMLRASRENPTYNALQNARPQTSEWSETMDRRSSGGEGEKGKWWNLNERSKSYRATSTRATSTSGNTDSSIRTISSVVDAMKRFSGYNAGNRIFSTVRDKVSAAGESASSGDGATTPPTFVKPGEDGVPEGLGITNAKIRLYVRLAKAKWQDLGSARLSVLQKRPDDASDAGIDTPVALQTGFEKRIVVVNKKGTMRLLDVTLGESCFERVARTGIAVSVWEDVAAEGHVAAKGGVADKRTRVYMIQLKSERECAYTFSLLGKHRY